MYSCRLVSPKVHHPWIKQFEANIYSLRSESTGFTSAAFIYWLLTVTNAMTVVVNPAPKKNDHDTPTRYGNASSHRSMTYHAMGTHIMNAIINN
jgi:hypothetical protein